MESSNEDNGPTLPRLLAVFLAIGGVFWGLVLISGFGLAAFLPPFGLGYFLTVGYVVRVLSVPSLQTRRIIWVASIIVQGWWLIAFGLPDMWMRGPNSASLWWVFASVASVVALATERK
jgi:hypothetical protein